MLLKFLLLPILAEASFDLNYMKSKKIEFIKNSKISLISQNVVFENISRWCNKHCFLSNNHFLTLIFSTDNRIEVSCK